MACRRQSSLLQVETKNHELYRGELYEAEDNWNCQMREVQMTARVSSPRFLLHATALCAQQHQLAASI